MAKAKKLEAIEKGTILEDSDGKKHCFVRRVRAVLDPDTKESKNHYFVSDYHPNTMDLLGDRKNDWVLDDSEIKGANLKISSVSWLPSDTTD